MTSVHATPRSVATMGAQHHLSHHQQPQKTGPAAVPLLGGPPSDKHYGFPIESNDVLLGTLAKIGITEIRESDIVKPTPQVVLTCFTAFLELLSFVNDDVVDTLKNDCLERLEHKELYDESLQFLIRFREIRALMIASCVLDFNVSDITRPKPKRFKKQVYALINFLRFSEHQIQHFDKLKESNDLVFRERDEMAGKLGDVENRVREEEEMRQEQEAKTLELREINSSLSDKLRELKEEQSRLLNELEDAKQDKNSVHSKLLKLVESSRLLGEEIEKLNIRIENTPKELREMIEKHKRQIKEKRAALSDEEAKAQSMFEKKRVLEGLEADIAACTQLVQSCLEEQIKVMREKQELDAVQGEAQDLSKERDNLSVQIEQLQADFKWAAERLERTQKAIEAKRAENKRKAEQGAQDWEAVQTEKQERQRQVESLNQQIAALEEEYEKITRDFDDFYANLLEQKQRLEAQCNTYMRAIAQRMDLQIDL